MYGIPFTSLRGMDSAEDEVVLVEVRGSCQVTRRRRRIEHEIADHALARRVACSDCSELIEIPRAAGCCGMHPLHYGFVEGSKPLDLAFRSRHLRAVPERITQLGYFTGGRIGHRTERAQPLERTFAGSGSRAYTKLLQQPARRGRTHSVQKQQDAKPAQLIERVL